GVRAGGIESAAGGAEGEESIGALGGASVGILQETTIDDEVRRRVRGLADRAGRATVAEQAGGTRAERAAGDRGNARVSIRRAKSRRAGTGLNNVAARERIADEIDPLSHGIAAVEAEGAVVDDGAADRQGPCRSPVAELDDAGVDRGGPGVAV